MTSLNLQYNQLAKVGSIEEVGNILLKTGKQIMLDDDDKFEKKLKKYLQKAMLEIVLATKEPNFLLKNKAPKSQPKKNTWYQFFGSNRVGISNHRLGDMNVLKTIRQFLY